MDSMKQNPEENIFASYYDLTILAFIDNDKIKGIKHVGGCVEAFIFRKDNVFDNEKVEKMRFSTFIERARKYGIDYYAYYLEMNSIFSVDVYISFTKNKLDRFLKEHPERKATQHGFLFSGKLYDSLISQWQDTREQ